MIALYKTMIIFSALTAMCESKPSRCISLHRVNSGGGEAFDSVSEYFGGNLHVSSAGVFPTFDEKEFSSDEEDYDDLVSEDSQPISLNDYRKADKLLSETFDINVLEETVKNLLSGKILPDELVIQSLAYKNQKINRGKNGVRYLSSWGSFWAGVREIVKSRGLVPFLDHFEVCNLLRL